MSTRPVKILIVDDEPACTAAIRRALTSGHLEVAIAVAGSFSSYQDAVADDPPDLAIIDLRLTDGRSDIPLTMAPEIGKFPIIVLTDNIDEAIELGTRGSGSLDCVVKSAEAFAAMPWTVIRVLRDWNLLIERERTAEAQRACEEKFRAYTEETLRRGDLLHITGEIASVGGWEFDVATGAGRWTEEVARIHEVDPLMNTSVAVGLGFFTRESRPTIERAVNDAVTRAISYDLELEIVTAKGSRKWVRTKGVPVVKDGKVVQVRGILQDITERKRTEELLKASEARLAAIVDTAVDAIITIDDQGVVKSFNPAAEKIFGYTSKEIVGRSLSLLMPPPHREQHVQYVARFRSTGEKRVLGVQRELLAVRKDGSTFPIEIGVSEIHVNGDQLFVGILRDVSERKLAQEALRE